jgi:hypothetical protein
LTRAPRPIARALPAALAVAAVVAAGPSAYAQLYLRGDPKPAAAAVSGVTDQGVLVGEGKAAKLVGWDRVREVKGEHAAGATPYAPLADALWRARTRVERGDFAGAEALLEPLAATEAGKVGPAAAVTFEGLTRCRLARGVQTRAVWSWLAWLGAKEGLSSPRPSGWQGGVVDLPPMSDSATALVPALPPMWLKDAALEAAAGSAEWESLDALPQDVQPLAKLYRAAMRAEAGGGATDADLAVQATTDGVRLVQAVVLARAGDEKQREAARATLTRRLQDKAIPAWQELWCRVALGRSLVRESDPALKRRGMIQLLHAPARFPRLSPYLASLALAEAAVTAQEMGDAAGAAALKAELLDAYPQSNAAAWPKLREIKPPATGTPAAPASAAAPEVGGAGIASTKEGS